MKYYLIAGEASGDLHGANLMRAIREIDTNSQFRFWGGDAMSEIGGKPVRHIKDLAFMGFVEVIGHLNTILNNIEFCKKDILQYGPDVVVGIDYPGFNLKIENWAHANGIHTVHYISPNLWAWKKGRIHKMKKVQDLLCYILPFEKEFFAKNKMPQAVYVGHPLLDAIQFYKKEKFAHIDSTTDLLKPTIALLPGSRRMEIKKNLPLMIQLAMKHQEYCFVVAGISLVERELYERYIPQKSNVTLEIDNTYNILSRAYAAVVCSGTATLETALFNVPQVVCYRANPVSVALARALVSRRLKYISLVNLIADYPIVTELIQEDYNIERLESEFESLTKDESYRARMLSRYTQMQNQLGDGGASKRTALAIKNLLQ